MIYLPTIPTLYGLPWSTVGGSFGASFNILNTKPIIATASKYGWLNALGEEAGYLESVATLRNVGSHPNDITQGTESARPICLRHSGVNYLHLPGSDGNNATIPDSPELDITGDITIESKIHWKNGNSGWIATKDDASTDRSWGFFISSTGELYFEWFDLSSTFNNTGFSDDNISEGIQWIRISLDVDNGAGGHEVKFYQSLDGINWTQLGSTYVGVGTTSIFSSSEDVKLGARDSGFLRGAFYQFKMFASLIESDERLHVNFSTFAHGSNTGLAQTGQIVTINKTGTNPAFLVGRSLLQFDGVDDFMSLGTHIWLDAQPRSMVAVYQNTRVTGTGMVAGQGDNAGPNGSYYEFQFRDSPAGDPYLVGFDSPYDITDSTAPTLTRKIASSTYDGSLGILYRNGINIASKSMSLSSAAYPFDVGRQDNTCDFFVGYIEDIYAYDYTLSPSKINSIYLSLRTNFIDPLGLNPSLAISSEYGWLNAVGDEAQYLESVATLVNAGSGSNGIQTTESSRPICLAHDGTNYLHLPAVPGNGAFIPYSAPLDVVGDVTLDAYIYTDNYGQSGNPRIFSRRSFDGPYGYELVQVAGSLYLAYYHPVDGHRLEGGSGLIPYPPKTWIWVRVTRVAATGALSFYTSLDGDTWTQLGATAIWGTGNTTTSTEPVWVGSFGGSFDLFRGGVKRIRMYADVTQTDLRLDVDFSTFDNGAISGVAASGQPVTITQSGGNMATLVGYPMLRFDGSDDSFFVASPNIEGPVTLVYVMKQNELQSVLIYKNPSDIGYTGANDDTSLNPVVESTPDGVAIYKKNGLPTTIANRTDLSNEISFQRILLTSTYTYNSTGYSGFNFGNFGGVNSWLGDLEAIYVYNRILSETELSNLEKHLLSYYDI